MPTFQGFTPGYPLGPICSLTLISPMPSKEQWPRDLAASQGHKVVQRSSLDLPFSTPLPNLGKTGFITPSYFCLRFQRLCKCFILMWSVTVKTDEDSCSQHQTLAYVYLVLELLTDVKDVGCSKGCCWELFHNQREQALGQSQHRKR
jgi:hypothetical protein